LERIGREEELAPAPEESRRHDALAYHEARGRAERQRRRQLEQIDLALASQLAQHLVGRDANGIDVGAEVEERALLAEGIELVVAGAEEALGQKAPEDLDEAGLEIERGAAEEQLGRLAAAQRVEH